MTQTIKTIGLIIALNLCLALKTVAQQSQLPDIPKPTSSVTTTGTVTAHSSPLLIPSESRAKREEIKWTDLLTAYATFAGTLIAISAAIAAAVSAYYSYRTVRQSDATERERVTTAKSERLSALWTDIQELRFLSTDELKNVDRKDVAEAVRRNINIMEKIGLWWDANLIDRNITAEEIATSYVPLFEQIRGLGEMPELARTGLDLIEENPRTQKLYQDLKEYLVEKAKTPSPNSQHS
jgi:hypothetical protein